MASEVVRKAELVAVSNARFKQIGCAPVKLVTGSVFKFNTYERMIVLTTLYIVHREGYSCDWVARRLTDPGF